jgi:predicted transcriptional regulator of viral defense system
MGKNSFSLSEVNEKFAHKSPSQIKNALNRLVKSGKVVSVWRGFYVIMLPEYGLRGIIPPTEYIDHLMKHLGKNYYVAILSAASLQGASHQKQQVFSFVCDQILHPKTKNEISLAPLLKKRIPHSYVEKKNVKSGTINVSTPILTAIDLVLYPQKSGGWGNVATVLSELAESIELNNLGSDFFSFAPVSAVQRLGYLLDNVIGETTLADSLMASAEAASLNFRKIPLVSHLDADGLNNYHYNTKWKIVINEEIEDDL